MSLPLLRAELKRADIRHDAQTVLGCDTLVVAVHRAVAVGDHVIKVAVGRVSQSIDVKRRRPGKAALNDHALAVPQPAVTGGTEDFELLMAALDVGRR